MSCFGGFGFGRLWKAFEKPFWVLGGCGFSIVCLSPEALEALGGTGRLWETLGGFGKFESFWEALGGFGRLWEALEGFGMVRKAVGGFGRPWKALFGRHGKALGGFWMFWDALEGWQPGFGPMDALEGFGGFRSL